MEKIKRKSGIRFRDSITINGRKINSPVFKRKTDCIQWLAEQRTNRTETALYGDSFKLMESLSLKEYSTEWINSKRAMGLSLSSINNYESYLRVHILPVLGQRDLKKIDKKRP